MKKEMKFRKTANFENIEQEKVSSFENQHNIYSLHANTLGQTNIRQKEHCLALDNALPQEFYDIAMLSYEKTGFLGYAFLEKISQNALISAGVETLADEMTRRFINLYSLDNKNNDTSKRLEQIKKEIQKFAIQDIFRQAAEKIGYYGGCLLFIDNGTPKNLLHTPLILDKATFKANSLKSFRIIDPINCSPGRYNSTEPLRSDYFLPQTWWVQGQEVHASRFLHFVGKEAPLLYKPMYNFFGVPIAQMAWDYVVHFTQSREAAARLLTKFSLTALKTNMSGALAGEGTSSLDARLSYFTEKQNNNGIFAIDKEQEDLIKLDTSLAGSTEIVRQALELLATIFRIPAVKLLGISPSGFNATGKSDIHNFYDYCSSMQAKYLSANMYKLLEILQLNSFSSIDENIAFSWLPLGEEEKKLQAEIEQIKASTIAELYEKGLLEKEEARRKLHSHNEI